MFESDCRRTFPNAVACKNVADSYITSRDV